MVVCKSFRGENLTRNWQRPKIGAFVEKSIHGVEKSKKNELTLFDRGSQYIYIYIIQAWVSRKIRYSILKITFGPVVRLK